MQVEDIRTVIIDGEKWYFGSDVSTALYYVNPSAAIQDYVDNEDKKKYRIRTSYGIKDITIINKHGLEVLVSSSIKPNTLDVARRCKKTWY